MNNTVLKWQQRSLRAENRLGVLRGFFLWVDGNTKERICCGVGMEAKLILSDLSWQIPWPRPEMRCMQTQSLERWSCGSREFLQWALEVLLWLSLSKNESYGWVKQAGSRDTDYPCWLMLESHRACSLWLPLKEPQVLIARKLPGGLKPPAV